MTDFTQTMQILGEKPEEGRVDLNSYTRDTKPRTPHCAPIPITAVIVRSLLRLYELNRIKLGLH